MAVMVSRANIDSHAHLVAALVRVGDDDTTVVFFGETQWRNVLEGAAMELEPGAIALAMDKGVCGD